jgi:hypothetical protein
VAARGVGVSLLVACTAASYRCENLSGSRTGVLWNSDLAKKAARSSSDAVAPRAMVRARRVLSVMEASGDAKCASATPCKV